MYTEGTSALKNEYYTSTPVHTPANNKTQVKKKKAVNMRLLKMRVMCVLLAAFVMAFTVLFRYAVINEEFGKLSDSREKLELINAKVVEKKVQAEGNVDPKKIEQEAQRLGLQQPVKKQIKYISLGNTDNGEVLKTEETSTFSAFINRVSVILEYLY